MKRIKWTLGAPCLIAAILVGFPACGSEYIAPENCCIVSIPKGFELWNNDENANFHPIDTPIKGIERKADRRYYAVTKSASFSIINFDDYAIDAETKWKGSVLTGFDVSGKVWDYSPSLHNEITLSCTQNTDIMPVYQPFERAGIVAFVGDDHESVWNSVWNLDACFDDEGEVVKTEGFYYFIKFTRPSEVAWGTNLPESDVTFADDSVTCTADRIPLSEGQQILYCVLNKYNDTQYFVESPALGDDPSAPLVSISVEIENCEEDSVMNLIFRNPED